MYGKGTSHINWQNTKHTKFYLSIQLTSTNGGTCDWSVYFHRDISSSRDSNNALCLRTCLSCHRRKVSVWELWSTYRKYSAMMSIHSSVPKGHKVPRQLRLDTRHYGNNPLISIWFHGYKGSQVNRTWQQQLEGWVSSCVWILQYVKIRIQYVLCEHNKEFL